MGSPRRRLAVRRRRLWRRRRNSVHPGSL